MPEAKLPVDGDSWEQLAFCLKLEAHGSVGEGSVNRILKKPAIDADTLCGLRNVYLESFKLTQPHRYQRTTSCGFAVAQGEVDSAAPGQGLSSADCRKRIRLWAPTQLVGQFKGPTLYPTIFQTLRTSCL